MDNNYSKSFSGTDIKAILVNEDGSVDYLPELQRFSVKVNGSFCQCFMTCIVCEESNFNRIKNAKDIVFYYANEYQKVAFSYLRDKCLLDGQSGIYTMDLSIDDLIMEETIAVCSSNYQPWTKWPEVDTEESTFALEVWNKWKNNEEIEE